MAEVDFDGQANAIRHQQVLRRRERPKVAVVRSTQRTEPALCDWAVVVVAFEFAAFAHCRVLVASVRAIGQLAIATSQVRAFLQSAALGPAHQAAMTMKAGAPYCEDATQACSLATFAAESFAAVAFAAFAVVGFVAFACACALDGVVAAVAAVVVGAALAAVVVAFAKAVALEPVAQLPFAW